MQFSVIRLSRPLITIGFAPYTRPKHRLAKKARLVLFKKLQGVRQIACLKQQRFLSFTFYITQRSYEKIMCIYLFNWFSGENRIIFLFSLHK